jgi:outer membrane protein insertion porin family
VKEKSRLVAKTGTEVGNAEGSAYANLFARNLFGGAESLSLYGSLGTRTRSAYQGTFETPILSNPDLKWEIGGVASTTQKSWASHEELLKEGWTRLRWLTAWGHRHELSYSGAWRQVTGLDAAASRIVRADAGDSAKSSITHTWTVDRRDYPLLAHQGYYIRTRTELAGWGPLRGDVAFGKAEVETQTAMPIPLPGRPGPSGIALTTGFRAGLLYPLALNGGTAIQPSRINDRFTLGGPTDVRGFRIAGLGPRDGRDAVGGDVYAAGSANLLLPLPRVGPDRPIRLQAFINGGRLLALQREGEKAVTPEDVRSRVAATARELTNELPSVAAGVGLVYAHPQARFELNFSLPLLLRKGEEGRKGLQFGIGINLL